jgi:hypothetical protein
MPGEEEDHAYSVYQFSVPGSQFPVKNESALHWELGTESSELMADSRQEPNQAPPQPGEVAQNRKFRAR